jgi:hypothetical protein
MSILVSFASFALRPIMKGIARGIPTEIGQAYAEELARAAADYWKSRFTDPSGRLQDAVLRSTKRSWLAIEIALRGETVYTQLRDLAEDKELRGQLKAFLAANPLQLPANDNDVFRKKALADILDAQAKGIIPGSAYSTKSIDKQAAYFARFATSTNLLEAEWKVINSVSQVLRDRGYAALAELLDLRPDPTEPPLLAMMVRFFLRREVETSAELFQGLVYDQVDQIRLDLNVGIQSLHDTLSHHGDQLYRLLTTAEAMRSDIEALKFEQARQGTQHRRQGETLEKLYEEFVGIRQSVNTANNRGKLPSDVISPQSADIELIKAAKANLEVIPKDQRKFHPTLFAVYRKLELGATVRFLRPQMFSLLPSLVSKADEILQHVDQLLLQDLCSAYKIIARIHMLQSERQQLDNIRQAEQQLRRCIGLDPESTIAGKKTSFWIARAYFGLSLLAFIQGEEADSIQFLLTACVEDPREARDFFAIELCKELYIPQCNDIEEAYSKKLERLPDYAKQAWSIRGKLTWQYTKVAGVFGLAAGMWVLSGGRADLRAVNIGNAHNRSQREATSKIEALHKELARVPTEESIRREREAALDARVKQLAQQSLDAMISKGAQKEAYRMVQQKMASAANAAIVKQDLQ